jgi:hypothetical protein
MREKNPLAFHFVRGTLIAAPVMLAACSDPAPMSRAPLVNSGSYDWQDQLRGPNGYPLPGWGYVVNKAL